MLNNPKQYKMTAETGKYSVKGGSIEMKVKRGEKSWAYFALAYNILLTISLSLVSVLPDFSHGALIKIVLIVFISLVLFRLCFYNSWFRNKIVGVFGGAQEVEEIR